ncbi:hypothetical protein ABIE59_004012, partial [Marinobacter sp. MBR-99]
ESESSVSDGRDKNYKNQAVGRAQNWVFLQPR